MTPGEKAALRRRAGKTPLSTWARARLLAPDRVRDLEEEGADADDAPPAAPATSRDVSSRQPRTFVPTPDAALEDLRLRADSDRQREAIRSIESAITTIRMNVPGLLAGSATPRLGLLLQSFLGGAMEELRRLGWSEDAWTIALAVQLLERIPEEWQEAADTAQWLAEELDNLISRAAEAEE